MRQKNRGGIRRAGTASKAVGYRGENREKLKKDFGIKSLKIVEKNGPMLYNILLRVYE